MPKRTINAKEILADIKMGLGNASLMEKYGLSEKVLQSVLKKLVDSGKLNQGELERRMAESETAIEYAWKCPACGKSQIRVYEECPDCGVISATVSPRRLKEHSHPQSYNYETHDVNSGLRTRWPVILVTILTLLVVGGAILKWSSYIPIKVSIHTFESIPENIRSFTAANFERDVEDASKTMPVLIMFYADS
jgi:hypothetical protein